MYKNKTILAVVPARGGSKGVPKKAIKPLLGKPLILYCLETLKKSGYIDKIIVSTEDDEIINICKPHAEIHKRDGKLAEDSTPLDPVILDVVKKNKEYDYTITFQPTSPLLQLKTIDGAIKKFIEENTNGFMSLREETHLYWKQNSKGEITSDFKERVNRQYLPKKYVETGAIIGIKTNFFLKYKTRVDVNSTSVLVTPARESVDIDTYDDWIYTKSLLQQKIIAINIIGNKEIGLGHIYRQLHIALNLDTKPVFYTKEGNTLAKKIIQDHNYEIIEYKNDNELLNYLQGSKTDIVINDILDTSIKYITQLKDLGLKIINFEDLGEGKEFADYTINELYEFTEEKKNLLNGYKYIILRDDIVNQNKKRIRKEVKNITISCGGTDENNLTLLYLKSLQNICYIGNITIIIGPGYVHKNSLVKYVKGIKKIKILESISNMGEVLKNADIVLTSNGRTIYEITCIGVPAISVSQNEREMHHSFANLSGCIQNLGLVSLIDSVKLESNINSLIIDFEARKKINKKMLSYNLKNGINNFFKILQSL